jgi:MFS family permease
MSVLAHWFKKRRSTALGIIAFASSIGGTVFPVVFHNLLVSVGYAQIMNPLAHHPAKIPYSFKWTMRIIASILGLAMGIMNLVRILRRPQWMCEYASVIVRLYDADFPQPRFLAACLTQSSSGLLRTQYIRHLASSLSSASTQVGQHYHLVITLD